MPVSISEEKYAGKPFWRRKARSLDLSDTSMSGDYKERSKAAKNHESPVYNAEWRAGDTSNTSWERNRSSSSSSSDRKDWRFRREAANVISSSPSNMNAASAGSVWDCGSKLYDTFELVSFSNRLDRSLLSVPVLDALKFHHVQSPLHHARVLRTLSSPSIPSSQISSATAPATAAMDAPAAAQVNNCHELPASCVNRSCLHENVEHVSVRRAPRSSVVHGLVTTTKSKYSSCASQAFFAKWVTKIVKMASFHGKMCFKANLEREKTIAAEPSWTSMNGDEGAVKFVEQEQAWEWEWEWEHERTYRIYKEKEKEGHTHFHYHHYHHHHHFLHQSNHSGTACTAESQLQH